VNYTQRRFTVVGLSGQTSILKESLGCPLKCTNCGVCIRLGRKKNLSSQGEFGFSFLSSTNFFPLYKFLGPKLARSVSK
jgi:hypothetical protein